MDVDSPHVTDCGSETLQNCVSFSEALLPTASGLLRKRGLVYLRPAALFPLLHFAVLQPSNLTAAPSEAIDPSVVVNVPTGLQLSPCYGFLPLRFNCLLVFVFVLTQRVRNVLLLMCSDAETAWSCVSVFVWQLRAGKAPLLLEVLTEW